jgi:hypothetical protein
MLHKLFEDYLKEKLYLKNVSPATIRSYLQAFDRFCKSGGTELSRQRMRRGCNLFLWEATKTNAGS